MFITGGTNRPTPTPELKGTLWHCEKCGSFLSIHSKRVVKELSCPICLNELEFCVAFDSGFGQVLGEA
jgi:hypothetical protein